MRNTRPFFSRSRRGYTLVEMVVVTAILAMMAGLVVPNMVAMARSRAEREMEAALIRLPLEARNQAILANAPMVLRIEGDDLVLEQDTEVTDATNGNTSNLRPSSSLNGQNNNQGQSTTATRPTKRVTLATGVQIESAQQNGENIDTSAWRWVVYPDGSADSGGVVFDIGSQRKSLYLPAKGGAQWIEGDLPDTSTEHWQAGELEQRVTS